MLDTQTQKEDFLFSNDTQAFKLCDSISQLSPIEIQSWTRILSAIASSEGMEHTVLEPLCLFYTHKSTTSRFLQHQAEDEQRHAQYLQKYLFETFGFQKMKLTFSDAIFYKILFPNLKKLIHKDPLYGLSLLYFYEFFAMDLYDLLKKKCVGNQMIQLLMLISSIQKDEKNHVQGIGKLIDSELEKSAHTKKRAFFLKHFLNLASLDVNFSKFAIHNRSIRRSLINLNFPLSKIDQMRVSALSRVYTRLKF